LDTTHDYRKIINVAGTMTALGASSVSDEVIAAMADVLPRFVDMVDLQRRACKAIQRVIGCEAGCVTACCASAMVLGIAACMTGSEMGKVEQLPDTTGLKDQVILQRGHSIWFGGSVPQMARIAGCRIVEIGDTTRAGAYQLETALSEQTAAALYVVSHHTVQYGLIDLRTFCNVTHDKGVPVIVDAASESNMKVFFERGADLVCFSGHKFLAGPTSGILAGRADLIEAALFHQYHGIGRAMKAGKESIVGATAALERWHQLDHQEILRGQKHLLETIRDELKGTPGLQLEIVPDPTESPTKRLRVTVEQETIGLSAYIISKELSSGDPAIAVRDEETVDGGYFLLDPTCASLEEAQEVGSAILRLVNLSAEGKSAICARYPETPNHADQLVAGLKDWVPLSRDGR